MPPTMKAPIPARQKPSSLWLGPVCTPPSRPSRSGVLTVFIIPPATKSSSLSERRLICVFMSASCFDPSCTRDAATLTRVHWSLDLDHDGRLAALTWSDKFEDPVPGLRTLRDA